MSVLSLNITQLQKFLSQFIVNLLHTPAWSFKPQQSTFLSASLQLLSPQTEPNFPLEMKMSVVSKKLWCVHKELILLLTPLILLPLIFTLPEKVSDISSHVHFPCKGWKIGVYSQICTRNVTIVEKCIKNSTFFFLVVSARVSQE